MNNEDLSATEKGLTEFLGCLNDWVDDQTLEESVLVWRERLSTRSKEHYRASWCLRELAERDRSAAVSAAIELDKWELFNDGQFNQELIRVVAVLIRFPKVEELEEYLRSLSIPLGAVLEGFSHVYPMLAEDIIVSRGAAHRFDIESGFFPVRHDRLMQELSVNTELNSATFSEIAPEEDDRSMKYQLKAVLNGKTYEMQAENFGDCYDAETAIKFLNEITTVQGFNVKFVFLYTGDQTACVWPVEPSVLTTLLDEGLIQLVPDYQSST